MPGKPFQKGHDPRRNLGEHSVKGRLITLPNLKEAIKKEFSKENGGITAVEAMIRGQINSAIKGNTRAFEVLMQLGYRKELNDAMNEANNEQQGTVTVGLFNPPKQKTEFITDVEEI